MRLPSLDLEMTYWRLRRRTQRVRGAIRDRMARVRADAHLRHLHRTGSLPERPQPEDTAAYRALWTIAIAGLLLVLAIDTVGEDRFIGEVTAVLTMGQRLPAMQEPALTEWSADTEALKRRTLPNT